jgi:hypothetical protein
MYAKIEKQDVEKYFDKIENAEIRLSLTSSFNHGIRFVYFVIYIMILIFTVFGEIFAPDAPLFIVIFGTDVPMFRFLLVWSFFMLFVEFVFFYIKRFVCIVKQYRGTDGGVHIFYLFKRKVIYMADGARLIVKKNKSKLIKKSVDLYGTEFWKIADNAEGFKVRGEDFGKRVVFTLGRDKNYFDIAPRVKLKIADDELKELKMDGKLYKYQKINSEDFSVELPQFAKEAFERNNIEATFVGFK